jgi:pSer/pThr/pTyr-binding forkhead associated (FHA) protein
VSKDEIVLAQKLNIIITVDKNRLAQNQVESSIKPDSVDRVFPLDLDENLVGRRSAGKGIYPEIEINDPGVSHRHLKFIKQNDGAFAVLELGSANGTEHNGVELQPGVSTVIKAGDEFAIGLWTTLKVVAR